MLADKDPGVRAEAARSLARFGDTDLVEQVGTLLLAGDTPADVKIGAIIGLGQGRSPAAAAPLSKVALDKDQPVRIRRYAIRALAQLANHAGAATLAKIAPLDSPAHDHVAVRYLDLGKPADTARMLIPILTAGEREDSGSAASRLAELGYGPGVRELCEGGDVFDNSARMMHMWGAIRSAGPEATAALIEASVSLRTAIRKVAAVALGGPQSQYWAMGGPGRADPLAVDALIRLCDDPDDGVRHMAAQSLGLTGDPAAVPVLINLARSDPAIRVAHEAIRALRRVDWAGRMEVKQAFEGLAGSARDCGVPDPKAPSLKDQPDHSFVLRKWPINYDDYSITNITYESSLTYDSDKGRVVQWGAHGRRADFPQLGDTWFYNPASNEWNRLTASRQTPNGVCLTWGTTYDPSTRSVIQPTSGHGGHGWINSLRANLAHSVPWVLDTTTDQWRPARPVRSTGYGLGQVNGVFDTEHDVTIFHHGPTWAYDAYENRFDKLGMGTLTARPDYGGACAWDPVTNRMISMAAPSGDKKLMQTWAFDPAANTWTNLHAAGGPPPLASRLMYDSANDVMLGFAPTASRGLQVWVYHLRENRWEQLPVVHPSPVFGSIDCVYDSRDNVVIFSGGWETGFSGELTQRETWTYRYKKAGASERNEKQPVGRIVARMVILRPDASSLAEPVELTWEPVPKAADYRLLRGAGDRPWNAKLEELKKSPLSPMTTSKVVRVMAPAGEQALFFRVEALNDKGEVIARSSLLRTRPPAVREVAAAVTSKGVHVTWSPPPTSAPDIEGYRVYRAAVNLKDPWSKEWDSGTLAGKLKLVSGDEPIDGTSFVDASAGDSLASSQPDISVQPNLSPKAGDTRIKSAAQADAELAASNGGKQDSPLAVSQSRPSDQSPSELHWPATFAYVVRAVNRWGVEGGDSPATLAIPDCPGPVRVLPWADGRRLVVWAAPEEDTGTPGRRDAGREEDTGTPGHRDTGTKSAGPTVPASPRLGVSASSSPAWHVMRMDDWIGTSVYRFNGGPVGCVGFYDDEPFPTGDRRIYFVVGVDSAGTLGVPSSGAWSHGFP